MADGEPGVADPADDAELSYEAARDALTGIVTRLEAGSLTLEESLTLWERGETLAEVCRARLDGARARLEAKTVGAPRARDEEER